MCIANQEMLVCPSCHHEVPLPSAAPVITLTSTMPHSSPSPPLSPVAASISSSTEQTTAAKNSACPCDAMPSFMLSQLNPPCHITPTCHASRTCHVTPVCRARAPCHVTPYVCGCALSHSQSSSQNSQSSSRNTHVALSLVCPPSRGCHALKSCSSYATSTGTNPSHNPPACFSLEQRAGLNSSSAINHNVNGNVSHCHWCSVSEAPLTAPCLSGGCETLRGDNPLLESSKTKLASLGSCPTSPSSLPSKGSTWPSNNVSQLNTKETLNENTSTKPCSGSECPGHGMCASYTVNSTPNSVCPNRFDSPQNSLLSRDATFNYNNCTDSGNCNSRAALARQISCPNANPAATRIVCPCHQQLQHESCTSVDGMPSEFPLGLFSQCNDVPQFSSHLLSPPISNGGFPTTRSGNSSGHFRIINSTGGGGVVIENQLSRSNSPELKFTFSVPLKGNLLSQSGSSSPAEQSCNTLSFDRDALMQTLASLPIIPVSSSASASTTHDSGHSHPLSSTSTHDDSVTFQNISSRTFVHSVPPCSSSSSNSSSPISFPPKILSTSSNHAHTAETRDLQWQHVPSHGKDSKCNGGSELGNVSGPTNHFITSINNFVMTTPVRATSPVGTGALNANPHVGCSWTSSDDARVLRQARAELDECGWYYGGLTWREAGSVLSGSSEGSFLVRDSWSGRCLYALSLQTARGPTSVRIEYESGKFRLESETAARDGVPHSSSVVALVQAYTQTTNPAHVWVDHSGQTVSAISVKKPLMRNPPTLQHLARLAYNASPIKVNLLDSRIPTLLKSYLESYPHTC
ncbi:SH2 domain [Trinorchestia longiramus]|nr:SH2 domain [Trinorchestia longiramus]